MEQIKDLKSLQELSSKEKIKYVFFWGHKARADGQLTKSCFSQWWPARFETNGITYATAEHYMMAEKARLFKDDEVLEKILSTGSPAQAKKLGRMVKNFDPKIWDQHRSEIVTQASVAKFSQDDQLKNFLLNTGNKVLVEASPMDCIWGIGMSERHDHAYNPLQWRGLNLLGFALMEARRRIVENEGKN